MLFGLVELQVLYDQLGRTHCLVCCGDDSTPTSPSSLSLLHLPTSIQSGGGGRESTGGTFLWAVQTRLEVVGTEDVKKLGGGGKN